jgi:tetratricopeptide (TPR) repeat protein
MDIDQYAFCPCGSGKKFKWCCQNIYGDIERAYTQLEEGQQQTALRIINEVTQKHPDNPEAWGQKAQVLLAVGQTAEAEKTIDRALEINPNYPFGLLLQARLRSDEGSFTGALILARRAAEAYHPEALDYLAQVYALIYQLEMQRHRPVAAHAALRILVRCEPGDQELRQALEVQFGSQSHLPDCARREYTFQKPQGSLSGERRQAWDRVLAELETPRLSHLAAAFEQLTSQDPGDAAAWFNLALSQAWLGENRKALDALDRYLPLEEDDRRATEAAALGEVLRVAAGMEDECDYHQYSVEYRLQDYQPLAKLFQEWQEAGRLMARQNKEDGVITGMVLETAAPSIITTGAPVAEDRRLGAYLAMAQGILRIWGPSEDSFNRLRDEIKTKTALTVSEGPVQAGPGSFTDVVAEALVFPAGGVSQEQIKELIVDSAAKHFEEVWVHRPLRSLAGNTPLNAVGSPPLRKKLLGVIQFLQDCAALGILSAYDFDRLRHKLGLAAGAAPPAPQAGTPAVDVGTMNAAELAALQVESLSDADLEKAFHAAQKLDAQEIASRFVTALVARPVAPEKGPVDRYPLFTYLVQRAMNEGNTDAALDYVNEGESQDCTHNEGRRRNDYELRRAQLHVKRREVDQAQDVFARLIERSPDNLKYRGSAAEGMLSLRQPQKALAFAETGLAAARRQNDRDTEQYLMELVEAANRQSKG